MNSTINKKMLLVLLILLPSLHAQWEERSTGLPDSWWMEGAIDAIDSSNAVVVLPAELELSWILKTTDAGKTWSELSYPESDDYFYIWDVSMVNQNNIFFCGNNRQGVSKIYATYDGGENWSINYESPDTISVVLEYIKMFDLNHGISVGSSYSDHPAPVLRTLDCGITWTEMNHDYLIGDYTGTYYKSIDFVNLNIGFFSKKWENLYKTIDGGKTWFSTFEPRWGLETVNFYDENFGLATTSDGFLYRTRDGGDSWEHIDQDVITDDVVFSYLPNEPEKICALQLYIEDSLIYNSADSGKTWTSVPFDSKYKGVDMVFTSKSNGWILSNYSVYYTNEGDIINSLQTQDIPSIEKIKIYQNYPNPFNSSTQITFDRIRPVKYIFLG